MTEIINTISDPVFVKDEQHRWQIVNDSFCDFVGIAHADLLGKSDYDFYPKEQADISWEKDKQVLMSGVEEINEEQLTTNQNETCYLETKKTVFQKASGEKFLVAILRDITSIRQAEQEMSDLRNLLRNIIDSMPSTLVTIDNQGRVSQWNQQAEKLAGLPAETAIGQQIQAALPFMSPYLALIDRALISRQTQKTTKTVRDAQGNKQFFEVMIYPLLADAMSGAVIRIDNVSDRVRIEEVLVQSEKMMSLGGLAAGMAHEINNPLAGIMQNAEIIQTRLKAGITKNDQLAADLGLDLEKVEQFMEQRKITQMLEMILESSHRAAKIVRDMLCFSRNESSELFPCNLALTIEQALELANQDLTGAYNFRALQIDQDIPANLPTVMAVKSQLQQVILNLLKNSAQALHSWCDLQDKPGIRISVTSKKTEVTIRIADNGPGIVEEHLKRIFEPFVTTKDAGNGTGLGLSVSYYIITNTHKGTLTVDSIPGQGTCFNICLPLSQSQPLYSI